MPITIAVLILGVAAQIVGATPSAPERFPYPPAAEPTAEHVFQLLTHDHAADAIPLLDELVQEAPDNPRTYRLVGLVYADAGRHDDAVSALTRALELQIDGPRRADVLITRARSYLALHRDADARADLGQVEEMDIDAPHLLGPTTLLELRLGESERALTHAQRLVARDGSNGAAHAMLALAYAERDDFESAEREVDASRRLGVRNEAFDEIDTRARQARLVRLAWQVPLAALAFLAVSLLLFFLLGAAFSRMQLGHLRDVRVHLQRGEQTAGERLTNRLYDAVVWGGTALFYLSVPAMFIVTLAIGPGAIGVCVFYLERVPVKLIMILAVVGLGGAWSIVRSLFLAKPPPRPGRRLEEREAPALFEALREVAGVARSRMVDEVIVATGDMVGVNEEGGSIAVLLGRGRRVLHLGFGVLGALSVSELKSILAHEFGHFSHGETRLTPFVGRIIDTTRATLIRMGSIGEYVKLNPAWWYLRLYFAVYLRATAAHTRRRELLADRAAALAYGGDRFAAALRKVIEAGDAVRRLALPIALALRESGRPCTDLYGHLERARTSMPDALRDTRIAPLLARTQTAYDTHPPPDDRIARVAGVEGARGDDPRPALALFADATALAKELTAKVVGSVESALIEQGRQPAPARDVGSQVDEAHAAALVADLYDALDVLERRDPRGAALVATARTKLDEALPSDDALRIVALSEVARSQFTVGDTSGARDSLDRVSGVLEVVEAEPRMASFAARHKRVVAQMRKALPREKAAAAAKS